MLQNSQRMELGEIGRCRRRIQRGGTIPCSRRRRMLRMPTSTSRIMSDSRSSRGHLEADVGDADHFPAVDVDNLLVEKIALDAQHVLVRMIRDRAFRC